MGEAFLSEVIICAHSDRSRGPQKPDDGGEETIGAHRDGSRGPQKPDDGGEEAIWAHSDRSHGPQIHSFIYSNVFIGSLASAWKH